MYVDGFVLLGLYILAASSLMISVYNLLEFKELIKRLSRPKIKKIASPVVTTNKRPKGHWDW